MNKPRTIHIIHSLLLACLLVGCQQQTQSKTKTPSPTPTPSSPAKPFKTQQLSKHIWRGVCLAHNWQNGGQQGYGTKASEETLNHLSGLGVDWISVTPFGFMRSINAPTVGGEHTKKSMPRGAERRERVIRMIQQAKSKKIKVMLKPHIWIAKGAWRGSIKPLTNQKVDWEGWWESYEQFILYYAKLAQDHKVESLVLGVELVSALKENPDTFLKLIAQVRTVYKGHITYSANWDEMLDARIWKALDGVSTQLYPPLSKAKNPKRQVLQRKLREHLDTWSLIAKKAGKPLLITEVGYKSAPTAVSEPFGWPERLPKSMKKQDLSLQKLAYEALFAELAKTPNLGGVFLWKYFTNKQTNEGGPLGFTPRQKPAEKVIKMAYTPWRG